MPQSRRHGKGVIISSVKEKNHCISMPCEIAIYRMVKKFQATDSWPDKIKF
jgi:hypothetical protein